LADFDWSKYKVVSQGNAGSGSNAPTPNNFDWSKYQVSQPAPSPQSGMLKGMAQSAITIPGDIAAGVAKGASGLLGLIPGVSGLEQKLNLAPEDMGNPSTLAGIQPNAADNVITNLSSYIPTALGGEAAIPARLAEGVAGMAGKNAILGSVYNTSQGGSPLVGAAFGGALSPGIAKVGLSSLGPASTAVKKQIGSLVTPGALKNFFSHGQSPEDILNSTEGQLRSNYNDAVATSSDKFNAAQGAANAADNDLGAGKKNPLSYQVNPFNNHDYVNSLNDIKSDLEKQASSPQAIAKVNQWIEGAPNNFSEAIAARKSINSTNVNYTDPSYDALKSATNKARASLVDTVNGNIAAQPSNAAVQNFGNAWKDANNHYSTQVVPFTQTFNGANVLQDNKNLAQALKLGTPSTNGDILKQFMPGASSNNTSNLHHLTGLLQDPDMAQSASRSLLLGKGYNQDGAPGASFLNKYKNLSPSVQKTLFSGEEKQALDNAQSSSSKGAGEKSSLLGMAGKSLAGMTLGGGALHSLGVPAELAYPAGLAAGAKGKEALQQILAPKSIADYNSLFSRGNSSIGSMVSSENKALPVANKALLALGAINAGRQG
tara:strand:- start:5512 stop:7314 length:1803 start_codon:yes stop_codon:yes gene_type:complete